MGGALTGDDLSPGLRFAYYEFDGGVRSVQALGDMPANRHGVTHDVELPPGVRDEQFGVLLTGYIQVPMDGSIILLQAGGETYQYHTGGDMQVFLCENPADEILGTPKSGDEFIPAPGIDD